MNYLFCNKNLTKSISFNYPGLFTLPSWLTFQGPSNRTAQTSASTLIRGVGTNQAVANIYGLQHEPAATNFIYAADFSNSWTINGTDNGYITDPSGTLYGKDLTSAVGGNGSFIGANSLVQTSTSFTASAWIKQTISGALNVAYMGSSTAGVVPICNAVENPIVGSSWHKIANTYNSTSVTNNYFLVGDVRTNGGGVQNRGGYACPQLESTPYATSFIPTSTVPVTRAASSLTLNLTNTTKFRFRYDAQMALPSTLTVTQLILRSSTSSFYVYLSSTGYLNSYSGNLLTDTTQLVWAVDDILSFRFVFSNSTSYTINIYKNNVFYYTKTFTHSAIPTFQSTGNWIGTDNVLTGNLSVKGYKYFSLGS
jgi:hypothetical protein